MAPHKNKGVLITFPLFKVGTFCKYHRREPHNPHTKKKKLESMYRQVKLKNLKMEVPKRNFFYVKSHYG